MKLIVPTLFATLACVFGCNKKENEIKTIPPQPGSGTQPQIIRVCNPGNLASLHPHTGIDLHCRIFQKALFEGLTRLAADGKPVLAGAQNVALSPSQTIYTFTLRPMQWTNGTPVTAFQFEHAWKSAIAPASSCLRSDLFYPIKNANAAKRGEVSLDQVGIHAVDAQILIVELEHPSPYFLDLIANPLFSPLFDESPVPSVFNGPFYVAQHAYDKKIVLRKNYGYWDSLHVALDTIEASFIADSTTALHLYEKGEIDWGGHPFTMLPHDALPRLEKSPDFYSKPLDGVYWLCVNTEQFPLSSPKIRQALSVALDRESLAHHVLLGETPTRSLIPTGIALLADHELYQDHNRKEAKVLFEEGLQELHLTQETFPTLIFSHSDIPGQKKLAEAIQECWQKTFGIDVQLKNAEWNVFFASLGERQFQIGGCIWFSAFHDPIYYLEFFKEKGHRYNAPQWENKHFQQLLKLADDEKNPSIRREHLRQAERLLLADMPVIPLFIYNAKYLKSPRVQGIEVINSGHIDFRWASALPSIGQF